MIYTLYTDMCHYFEYHFSNGLVINQWLSEDEADMDVLVPDDVKVTMVVVSKSLDDDDKPTIITPDNGVMYSYFDGADPDWQKGFADLVRVSTDPSLARHMKRFASANIAK